MMRSQHLDEAPYARSFARLEAGEGSRPCGESRVWESHRRVKARRESKSLGPLAVVIDNAKRRERRRKRWTSFDRPQPKEQTCPSIDAPPATSSTHCAN